MVPYRLKVTLLMAVVVAGAAGHAAAGKPLVNERELRDVGLTQFWEARLPLKDGESIRQAHLVDEALYVITTAGRIFSLTADIGLLRWGADVTAPDHKIHAPVHLRSADGSGPVVVPTANEMFVFDRYNGTLLTRFKIPFMAGGPAVASESALFLGGLDGRFYCFQLDRRRWLRPVKLWDVMAGGPVTAAPLLLGRETLLFASQAGVVFACSASDKTLLWTYRTGAPIVADLTADAGAVYVAGSDRSLYRLDLATGVAQWRVRFPRPLALGPAVAAHTVYQSCENHGLVAVDSDTGTVKWRHPNGLKLAAHARAGDVLFTTDRRLEVVDHETGESRGSIQIPTTIDVVTNTRNDAVYVLAGGNGVVCLRLDDTPYLRRQQVIAARRQLNLPPGAISDHRKTEKIERSDTTDPLADDPLRSRRDLPQ